MDTATPKYIQAAELIRSRVGHGEYLNLPLPGAPKLAKECGISYLTARQALARLVESGEFVRKDNGRIYRAGCELETPNLKIANIMPQHIGINYRWRNAIAASARDHGCSFSDVIYVNCDEPVIFETLDQDFDVIFFQIPEISEILFQKLLTMSGKLVSLFDDMTGYGIRCFDGMSQEAITVMMAIANHDEGAGLPVNEVAKRCGFAETRSFSRFIRRCHGVSPLELRKQGGRPQEPPAGQNSTSRMD